MRNTYIVTTTAPTNRGWSACALSTLENTEHTTLPIVQCKQSTPNSMGLNFDQSKNSLNRTGDVLERLADLMTQRYTWESLPLPEPETFKGDLLHYPPWQKSFDTIVEKRMDSPSQCLYYLGRYTAGEAQKAISEKYCLTDSEIHFSLQMPTGRK